MDELADDIDALVERCLDTGHLRPEDAVEVRQHLADDDPVRASLTLETAIDPQAGSRTGAVRVPTVSAETVPSEARR
ncbi:MAG: hypothetical protein ABEI99_12935 [Halobaculum sp.]